MIRELRIALRYLFSPKSHSAVNIISAVSVAGIAVATMAMVVVLSVFNGFHSLIEERLSLLDAPFKVEAAEGKTILRADSLAAAIAALPQVRAVAVTIDDQALAMIGSEQMTVRLRGVEPEAYASVVALDSVVAAGEAWVDYVPGRRSATLSVGVANRLRAYVGSETELLALFVPKRLGRINPANPLSAFRSDSLTVSAVYITNQQELDDNVVYVPLSTARRLLQYTSEASAIEVNAPESALTAIRTAVGPDYRVLTRYEQQAGAYQIVNMEKWMSFMLLGFILIVASFNIISTISLLILEKENNAVTLRAIGASRAFIRRIYAIQGWLITLAGGLLGIIVGSLLCLSQQHWGWLKLAGDESQLSITSYPVQLHFIDLLPILAMVALIAAVTSAFTISKKNVP